MIVAVAHKQFVGLSAAQLAAKLKPSGCFIDVKARFDVPARGRRAVRVEALNLGS
jgi:hypothetical protein